MEETLTSSAGVFTFTTVPTRPIACYYQDRRPDFKIALMAGGQSWEAKTISRADIDVLLRISYPT
jgi:hypothetical protein